VSVGRDGGPAIVSCGEALIDFVPMRTGGGLTGYRPIVGGSPFNVAIALARLEVPAGFLSRMSTDLFGRQLATALEDDGVHTGLLARGQEPTTLAFVSLAEGAEPEYAFYTSGSADRSLAEADIPAQLPASVECLHFGSFSLAQEPGASTLEALAERERGRRVIALDPNVRPTLVGGREAYVARVERWVGRSELVKVSRADLLWLYPGADPEVMARRWLGLGPALVAMTMGTEGALALTATLRIRVPGIAVRVVDTVGAGDSFHAAFLAALWRAGRLRPGRLAGVEAGELETALGFARRAAAVTCGRAGADPPRLSELEA
jgi:fructokinase